MEGMKAPIAFFCIPSIPLYVRSRQALVGGEDYHVVVATSKHMNGMAILEGKIEKHAGGRSVTVIGSGRSMGFLSVASVEFDLIVLCLDAKGNFPEAA
jgi:hypothetical protein